MYGCFGFVLFFLTLFCWLRFRLSKCSRNAA